MLRVKSKEAGNLPGLMVLLWAEALDKSPLGLTFSRHFQPATRPFSGARSYLSGRSGKSREVLLAGP
jgi:hypothetical protein